jgi:hypothetical protein
MRRTQQSRVRRNSFSSRALENCPLGVTRNCLLLRTGVLSPLPRVTEQTRRQLLKEIDEKGPFEFTRAAVGELDRAIHHFASGLGNYLQAMPRGHF